MINLAYFKNNYPENNAADLSGLSADYSLDDQRRVLLLKSPGDALLHPFEKYNRDQAILNEVKEIFQKRYGFQDAHAFERVWKRIGAKVWTPSQTLTLGTIQAIDEAFKTRLIYHGKGMPSALNSSEQATPVQKLAQYLLHGQPFPEELINPVTARAVLVKQNPQLLKELRTEIQRELEHLATQIPATPQEEIVWRTFLGNLLGFIPFTYPATGESLKVPVLHNGQCTLVEYSMQVIPLEFNKLASPMPAIGMTPKNDPTAPPVLAFIGTTFPAGEGFAATTQSDFTPGYSVGELAYDINHNKIAAWLQDKQNVHVVGISLGGAMGFHALRHHKEHLARVDVYNPPGLYAECWNEDLGTQCAVNIYCQPKDLVSKLGCWPTQGKISSYEVLQHQGISENMLASHVKAFSGAEQITIIKHDPEKQNQSLRRKILTVLHRILGPLLVFLPVEFVLLLSHYAKICFQFARRIISDFLKFLYTLTSR
jgi:hypothetical protein